MSTDDRHSDHDLKAYLDGRDGVSAAYRKSATEEPPRALDEAIRAAARKRVEPPPSAESRFAQRRPYALAASVMVAVLVVSLYFNALDEIAVPSALDQATVSTVQIQTAERLEATKPDAPAAGAAADEEAERAAPLQFETRQLAPTVPTVGAADSVAPPAAPAVASNRDAFARAAEPAPVVIDGPLLEEIEATAAAAQVRREEAVQAGIATPPEQQQENALQEIVVTGSRIMRRDEGDVSYRESRDTWIEEIAAMADEFAARSRLTTARAAAARIEEQLEEEIDLYLEAYPDADIEAELDALEE